MNKNQFNKLIGDYVLSEAKKEKLLREINSTKEIWKDIPNYEGLYQVSNRGSVKVLPKNANRKEKILKPNMKYPGYFYLNLVKNRQSRHYTIHRLVALTFIPNPENKKEVNHIDANKLNNLIPNLEWCTRQENIRHRDLNSLSPRGEKNGSSKLKEKQVRKILNLYNSGKIKCVTMARKYGVGQSTISDIIRRKTWRHII